jgi:hypothetical protein
MAILQRGKESQHCVRTPRLQPPCKRSIGACRRGRGPCQENKERGERAEVRGGEHVQETGTFWSVNAEQHVGNEASDL